MKQFVASFFAPRATVCKECGAHFEPLPEGHGEYHWRHLCAVHRKEPADYFRRQEVVRYWALANFDRLEAQMKEESAKAQSSAASLSNVGACYANTNASRNPFGRGLY